MLANLYFSTENGQMEINFDALALITSEEFGSMIKKNYGNNNVLDFEFQETTSYLFLYIYTKNEMISTYEFNKIDKTWRSGFIPIEILKKLGFKYGN